MKPVKLYVGNLPRGMSEEDLRRIFSGSGRVTGVKILCDPTGTECNAWIDMADAKDARAAIEYLDGREYDGKKLSVGFSANAAQSSKEDALFEIKSAPNPLEPPAVL